MARNHGGAPSEDSQIPVINLADAPGDRASWDRSRFVIYSWAVFELLFVTNAWQISSSLRVSVLRLFGANIGHDVIFRPGTRVKFPWKLRIGDRSWIGEGVRFHNQDQITLGADVCVSQESFLTTGSHAHRRDMALLTRPIHIHDGAWITTRCMVLGGVTIGRSALIRPNTVVDASVPANAIYGAVGAAVLAQRFPTIDND